MFSKSRRFNQSAPSTPAVGQYEVGKTPFDSTGAIHFPKDKRFKDPETTGESLLDISNCSSVSMKSSNSHWLNNSVFATPGKTCGKAKNKSSTLKSHEAVVENRQDENLPVQITELQEEIELLRFANQRLQKVQDGDANFESFEALNARIASLLEEVEKLQNENKMLNTKLSKLESSAQGRQTLQSNLCVLNDELEKLRKEIDEEIIRNKELLLQQSKYECSIEIMQADLDLANTQVKTLQGQINSLEQDNNDISENRKDLEDQCSELHGMTITLQKDKLTIQERLEDVENAFKNMKSSKESMATEMSSYIEQYEALVESREYTLYEKVTSLTEMGERLKATEETLGVHKNNIATLEHDLVEALALRKKTDAEMKIMREEKETLTASIKHLCEKHEKVVGEARQEISHLKEEMRRKEEQSLQNLESMTGKCEILENQLASLEKDRASEMERLQKELELSNASLDKNQEEYRTLNLVFKDTKKDYDMECENRVQLQQDLNTERESLKKVGTQLTKLQSCIAKLEQSEKEQRTTVEIFSTKLAECNRTINDLEKKIVEHQDMIEENNGFRNEIEALNEMLSKLCDDNRTLVAEQEKTSKVKQEIGRRLIETQTKLSQKEIDLQSCQKEFEDYVLKSKDEESWKRKYEELEERIAPFQEQLNAFEFEKQALLSRNSESQNEIEKLGQQYAKLLGHQNQKQKIRHVLKLKEENTSLKMQVAKLQEDSIKQKKSIRKMEEKSSKATGARRFDTSFAFKHNAVENKENTPLKTHPK